MYCWSDTGKQFSLGSAKQRSTEMLVVKLLYIHVWNDGEKRNKRNPGCENGTILGGCFCTTFTFPVCFFLCRQERDLARWKNPRRMPGRGRMTSKYASMRARHSLQCLKMNTVLNLSTCCLFCRKWSRRWPIGWWGSFGAPSSPPPCHRPNWLCMEAGRPRRSSLEPGWPKSYTPSGAQDLFKHAPHWFCALLTWLCIAVTQPMLLLSRGCHEALSALEIPNDLLQVIQDLLLELRVHCLMVTLLHTTDGEGGPFTGAVLSSMN